MKASLETNRRGTTSAIKVKEITLQETQGLKIFILLVIAIACSMLLIGYIYTSQVKINILEAENASLKQKVIDLELESSQTEADYSSTINKLKSNIISSNNVINTLNDEVLILKKDNKSLAKQYDKLNRHYKVLASRKELYDKYEYIVMYGGKRTDVTYKQIKIGEQLMMENGYDPNILFSIIMVESRGNASAKNVASSATGYGQFLTSTGRFVYEDLMKNGKGTYNHSMAKNGDLNIKMTAHYLDYLLSYHDNNLFNSIKNYSGRDTSGTNRYISWMNRFSETKGVDMFSLCSAMN